MSKKQSLMSKTPYLKKKMLDLATKAWDIGIDIDKLAEPHLPLGNAVYYKFDFTWGCPKSPFGWCAYDHMVDTAHDNCIFCYKPEERK